MNERLFKKLKIVYVSNNRAWAYCVYHDDIHRPNVSITLSPKYYGRWKCWACGKKGTLSNKQMKELDIEPLKEYDSHSKNYSTCWPSLISSYQNNLDRFPLLKEGLANEFNIDKRLLSDWRVGYDGQAFTIPMILNDGYVGIQRRFPSGKKCCIKGSKLGIISNLSTHFCFCHDNVDETLYICEGFTDAIAVNDLGFNIIARPHCHFINEVVSYLYNKAMYEEAWWYNIVIIPDNDKVGIDGATNLYNKINEKICPDEISIFEFSGAKDIRELIKLKGKVYVRQQLERYVLDRS